MPPTTPVSLSITSSATGETRQVGLGAALQQKIQEKTQTRLQQAANERFMKIFLESVPAELSQAGPQLTPLQFQQIVQETSHLFQRPIDDPWMLERIKDAKLPADRILADYHERTARLDVMSGDLGTKGRANVQRAGGILLTGAIAGILSMALGQDFLLRRFPKTSAWLRIPGAIGIGTVGAGLTVAAGSMITEHFKRQEIYGGALQVEAQVALDSGFAAEIQRMAAMAYLKKRAAAICAGENETIAPRPAMDAPAEPTVLAHTATWEKRMAEKSAEAQQACARTA